MAEVRRCQALETEFHSIILKGYGRAFHANSLLMVKASMVSNQLIKRLYRLRYLHRGQHRVPTGAQMLLYLWLSLSRPHPANSS